MLTYIFLDAPFTAEVKLNTWNATNCSQNSETDIKKVGNTVLATWIRSDGVLNVDGNYLRMSFDGGNTWSAPLNYSSNNPQCWIGDPAIAIQPDNPNVMLFAGMIYCQGQNPNDVRGEVYFCRCTAGTGCTNAGNWSCGILGPNDNWAYFKDKPWLLAIGNNTVLANYTTDKYGNPSLVIYRSTNNGANWTEIGRTNWPATVGYWTKDGNTIYMSYNDFTNVNNGQIGVGFLRSTNNGNSFQDVAWTFFNFGQSTSCPNYQRPAKIHDNITASNNKVAIAFVDGNCKARIGVWTGSGNNLNVYQIAPTGGGSQQVLPMVASSGNKIFAQWQGRISSYGSCGNFNVGTWSTYWAVSNDWGQTWSSPQRVSSSDHPFTENPLGHDYNGWIIEGGRIYTTWSNDYRGSQAGTNVYYSYTSTTSLEEVAFKKKPFSISYKEGFVIINAFKPFSIYSIDGKVVNSYGSGIYKLKNKQGLYFIVSEGYKEKVIFK
ncbi:MAG: glycoside hydrolase [candidate division WOR-3 bacterium]|nr:glycoside hydrolase [candidate division WOR-3 bacterium]MCX7947448.1 glycoside hydrolase [candidate division WOR-3 bacterium]MDW8150608.1 sialidase family protein [candidate division WOR-3 bacterium]